MQSIHPTQRPRSECEPVARAVEVALDRHESRRESERPTVTALIGSFPSTQRAWIRWAEKRNRRTVVLPRRADCDQVTQAWTRATLETQSAPSAAARWLAKTLELPVEEAGRRLQGTACEREDVLRQAIDATGAEAVAAICRLAVADEANIDSAEQGRLAEHTRLAEQTWLALPRCSPSGGADLSPLTALIPREETPVVLLRCNGSQAVEAFDFAARMLLKCAMDNPWWSAAVAASPCVLEQWLRETPEDFVKASIRESVIQVEEPTPACSKKAAGSSSAVGSKKVLRQRAIAEAARVASESSPDSPAEQDRARGEAERFLYLLLEHHPPTAGLFRLNAQAEFKFGSRPAELDLSCASLRIAIEVDGYYHFTSPDCYRRDRRKDAELQKHGWFVLRFLADDVVTEMETTLDAIVSIVNLRRGAALNQ
ncbi:MAG: endonuclease domain-containing protein, partial [Planctomycetales bacterium]